MDDITSDNKSLSLSSTLCISLMYLETFITAEEAISGPFLELSESTFIELSISFEGKYIIAPYCGLNMASLTLIPSLLIFVETVLKNSPDIVPSIVSATLSNASSTGIPSASLFPN